MISEKQRQKNNEASRLYYQNNKERIDARNKEYQKNHLEEHAETCKRFKVKNPGLAQKASRKWTRRTWALGEHERAENLLSTVTQCGCCSSSDPRNKVGWRADHNHKTGMFRSYICHPCNIIIGFIEKYNLDCGSMFIEYLIKFDGVTK